MIGMEMRLVTIFKRLEGEKMKEAKVAQILAKALNLETRNRIVGIIRQQYMIYNNKQSEASMQQIAREEYSPHHKASDISWTVKSGFPSCSDVLPGFTIARYETPGGWAQPLITDSQINLLLLRGEKIGKSNYYKEFIMQNQELDKAPIFAFISYVVEEEKLTKVQIIVPFLKQADLYKEILFDNTNCENVLPA